MSADTHRHTDTLAHRHTDTHRHADTQAHGHTGTQTHRHTHERRAGERERKAMEREMHAHTHTCIYVGWAEGQMHTTPTYILFYRHCLQYL